MYLHIATAVGGPLESKVAYWYNTVATGPLWKQGNLLNALQLLLGATLKAQWAFVKRSACTSQLLLGAI